MRNKPPDRTEVAASQRRGVTLDRLEYDDDTLVLRLFIQPDVQELDLEFVGAVGRLTRAIEAQPV